MNVFWIIIGLFIISLLFIEPIGYLLIRRKDVIYATDSRRFQYHSGDTVTRKILIEDRDDNIYLSDIDVPLFEDIEITYKGFNMPRIGLIPIIIDIKKLNKSDGNKKVY